MCVENGVEIITNTMISYIKEDADGVDLLITSKEGIHQINTKVVIDATGDANAVSMAGYDTVKSNIQQPATPQNHISGYTFENIDLEQIHANFSKANFPPQITENKKIALEIISFIYIFLAEMPKHQKEEQNLNMMQSNSY